MMTGSERAMIGSEVLKMGYSAAPADIAAAMDATIATVPERFAKSSAFSAISFACSEAIADLSAASIARSIAVAAFRSSAFLAFLIAVSKKFRADVVIPPIPFLFGFPSSVVSACRASLWPTSSTYLVAASRSAKFSSDIGLRVINSGGSILDLVHGKGHG